MSIIIQKQTGYLFDVYGVNTKDFYNTKTTEFSHTLTYFLIFDDEWKWVDSSEYKPSTDYNQ